MQTKIEKICTEVLNQVTPSKKQRAKIEALAKKLENKVISASKAYGIKALVRVEGSVAKDTWLNEEPEIDIFMRVPTTVPRKSLGDTCLKIAREATKGLRQIERFAEHPYLEAFVDDVRVNIVPCYETKRGEWLSATDRTPYHTDYINTHLDKQIRGEVRLLKKFMKGVGVYGAEIKIGGFSGYLCELLIMHYKSFAKVLEAFARHKQRIVVDIENFYKNRENELRLLFNEPLVIVDPVDKGRNVASAVQSQKLYTFVAAARAFLKKPSLSFFYPPETKALTIRELKETLEKRGSTIVFLAFEYVKAVPDVLWGQLYKSQRSLHRLVQINDFKVLRTIAWSDEKSLCIFILEFEQRFLSPIKKHFGPPLLKEKECDNFLKKHVCNLDTISGPYIEDGRWMVDVRRKYTDVVALLREKLRDGGRNAGMAELVSKGLQKEFKIFVNGEIVKTYQCNSEFAKFLTEFLSGKPKWLGPA